MRFSLLCLFSTLLFLAFHSCIPTNSNTQKTPEFYAKKYKSFLEKNNTTTLSKAGINYTIEAVTNSNKCIYKKYQPQKVVLLTYTEYKDSSLTTREGKSIIYGDDGRIMQKGNYTNNQKTGLWQYLSEKGNYIKGKRHGTWYKFNIDSLGNLTDTIVIKEYYSGRLIDRELTGSSKVTLAYLPICEKETRINRIKCTEKNLLKSVYSNVVYPIYARETGIQGLTYSSFIVDTTGQVKDIKVIRSICNQMETEIIRTIKLLPKFEPGLVDGKKFPMQYNLPVRFKLQ